MEEIKISLTEEGKDLINKYSKLRNISQKEFIKQAIIEKIEDEEDLETVRNYEQNKNSKKWKISPFSAEEFFKKLEINV